MKTVFIILMTLFMTKYSYARNISGRIIDEQQSPLEYASVVLLNADSIFVTSALSDENGLFSISDEGNGSYIAVSYIGYEQKTVEITHDDLGIIQLVPEASVLGEVVVTANKPIIKREVDRLVYNVSGTALSQGISFV